MKISIDTLYEQDFYRVDTSEEWLNWFPPVKYGEYRPQPSDTPEKYPCLFKMGELEVNHGADYRHVCIVYLED